jgi:hypothetical protein
MNIYNNMNHNFNYFVFYNFGGKCIMCIVKKIKLYKTEDTFSVFLYNFFFKY